MLSQFNQQKKKMKSRLGNDGFPRAKSVATRMSHRDAAAKLVVNVANDVYIQEDQQKQGVTYMQTERFDDTNDADMA